MFDINPDDSSGKVLPIEFIVYFSFGWKAFLAGDHTILLVALIIDTLSLEQCLLLLLLRFKYFYSMLPRSQKLTDAMLKCQMCISV